VALNQYTKFYPEHVEGFSKDGSWGGIRTPDPENVRD